MKFKHFIIIAFTITIFAGCKPTEQNYKRAYDAAQQGRNQRPSTDSELGMPALTPIDAPRRQIIDTDSVYVRHEPLRIHGQAPQSGLLRINVAVGKYKMTANALSDVEALRRDGFDSFLLSDSSGEFYVIAGTANTLQEGVALLKSFKRRYPDRKYLGLPGEPVIEIVSGAGL